MESQKNMYNSMLKALQNKSENSTYEKQLEAIKQMQAKQDDEINQIRKGYEKQITELKQQVNLQEFNIKNLNEQLKQNKSDYKQELREKDAIISELKLKVQQAHSSNNKTIEELRDQIERLEDKHLKEISELEGNTQDNMLYQKEDYESKLNDIKYLNEQEQLSYKAKIRKLEEEIALLKEAQHNYDMAASEAEDEKVKVLNIRLSEINDKYSEEMLISEKEIIALKKENEEAYSKIASLKVAMENLKTTMYTRLEEKDEKYSKLKEKLNQKSDEAQRAENKAKEVLRLKKKISDLKLMVSKLEGIKRDLRQTVKEKEDELEAERIAKKRALISERKKAKLKGDQLSQMKKEIDQKSIVIESLKRENLDQSKMDESRYYSPRALRGRYKQDEDLLNTDKKTAYSSRAFRLESPTHSNVNMTQTVNDSSSNLFSSKRLKSSSPNRSRVLMSTQKIRVGGLGRNRSARRLIQISTERVNTYDDTHAH